MRLPVSLNLVLALLLAATASACGAAAPGGSKFDLDCHGTAASNGRSGPFHRVMHVDLTKNRFCFDTCELIVSFTNVTPQQLKLHYDIDAPGGPKPYGYVGAAGAGGPVIISSGAPSQQKDDLTVDRATGAFRRDDVYDQGDPAATRYTEHWTGMCRVAPYSGKI